MSSYKSFCPKKISNKNEIIPVLGIVMMLISLPIKNIFVSIATISFLVSSIFINRSRELNFQKAFFVPVVFFAIMTISLLWTKDFNASLAGLQKGLSFLVIPLVFFIVPKFSKESINKIFRGYGFAMVGYAIFYVAAACIYYNKTNDIDVFFNNSLVPLDPGAIYMSVFASFGLFYFVQLDIKKNYEKIALSIVALFIFLLSSKSIITIDFIIIICYYIYFSKIPYGTKVSTLLTVSLFLFFSIFYVRDVRNRFFNEYETAFVDNIFHFKSNNFVNKTHNVTIKEAWNKNKFSKNDFFPGTALRIYQSRVYIEISNETKSFLTGLGLDASQKFIKNKALRHNLNEEYGGYNFHNQYIQTLAEIGLFGFVILIVMLFLNLKNGIKKKDFLHIAFAISMIVLFLSESFFCRQRGIVFFTLFYCLFNRFTYSEQKSITLS
ncbi:O-antigen ligase family protein [Flavobacterium aciduliphilum]|uniref:O-antigen ligase-like membrane protein n=1 Tax=Flavobacterium aciduliphilum TaxID=1101402 RepID=A0A328YS20_9FLAO|nr:O-antigen ligase family protein [Flavobacterium aciduliphilum]RAR72906.1 O-antigen ligase-like membrane protein [Flavobacterium aciduliphilum]